MLRNLVNNCILCFFEKPKRKQASKNQNASKSKVRKAESVEKRGKVRESEEEQGKLTPHRRA
jgi:hypothetical protein